MSLEKADTRDEKVEQTENEMKKFLEPTDPDSFEPSRTRISKEHFAETRTSARSSGTPQRRFREPSFLSRKWGWRQWSLFMVVPILFACGIVAYFHFKPRPSFTDAVFNGDMETTKYYILKQRSLAVAIVPGDPERRTALHIARYLVLQYGARLDAVDDNRWTPLHYAAMEGNREMVRFYVRHGADVNVKDQNERTPLHVAAIKGHREIIEALLDAHATTEDCDLDGMMPIQYAMLTENKPIVYLLESAQTKAQKAKPIKVKAKEKSKRFNS
eukprot:TRINITY_DN2830_c0_g1_i2.p1 TRINITY_DN2830_c0_g1~~TRINITY_DN2830_c0_g1_i2.p1  ORF type:complete len:272 (+),score=43.64 TRINITY_DN2830_c0_g1_i2:53-868(+)